MAAAWKRTWFLIAATTLAACKSAATSEREIPEAPPGESRYAGAEGSSSREIAPADPIGYSETEPASAHAASRVHVVKKGDTLFALARLYYRGDMAKWHAIYDANRDRIPNKDRLRIGQELVIPD